MFKFLEKGKFLRKLFAQNASLLVHAKTSEQARCLALDFLVPGNEALKSLNTLLHAPPLVLTAHEEAAAHYKSLYPDLSLILVNESNVEQLGTLIKLAYQEQVFKEIIVDFSLAPANFRKQPFYEELLVISGQTFGHMYKDYDLVGILRVMPPDFHIRPYIDTAWEIGTIIWQYEGRVFSNTHQPNPLELPEPEIVAYFQKRKKMRNKKR